MSFTCPRNKQFHRRLHSIHADKASLVHGQAKMSARIDIQQRLPEGNIAEGPDELHLHLFPTKLHRNILTSPVAELQKVVTIEICHQITEWSIGRNHVCHRSALVEPRR